MDIIIGTLLTMAIQAGTSIINQKYSKEGLDEIKKRQQEFKSATQERSIRRGYEKLKRSCEFQLKIEKDNHEERLRNIDQDFLNAFSKMAHNAALVSHYPLMISPYIIKSSVVPFYCTEIGNLRKEIFCILSNSNNKAFNSNVLPILDDMLCNIISAIWNENSMHTVCYYSNVWKENSLYCDEDIENLKTIIVTPTITVTPYFESREQGHVLTIKVNLWGIGMDLSVSIDTSVKFKTLPTKDEYSINDIYDITSRLFPEIVCAIAQNVDVYYWANYYQAPILPSILEKGLIRVDQQTIDEYGRAYIELYEAMALGILKQADMSMNDVALLKDVAYINQCNFPDRILGFLHNATDIQPTQEDSDRIIMNTLSYLYESKSDAKFESLSAIDVNLLDKGDMDQITEMIAIAKKCNNTLLTKQLIDIVKRKLLSWN